jgi:hypothetical protein
MSRLFETPRNTGLIDIEVKLNEDVGQYEAWGLTPWGEDKLLVAELVCMDEKLAYERLIKRLKSEGWVK